MKGSMNKLLINFAYYIERLLTNSIKFLIPFYMFNNTGNPHHLGLGYCLAFALFTYGGMLSSKIITLIKVEVLSKILSVLLVIVSFIVWITDLFNAYLVAYCLATLIGSMLNPLLHSIAKSHDVTMRPFSIAEKIAVFLSPLLVGLISICIKQESIILILIVGWVGIFMLLILVSDPHEEQSILPPKKSNITYYFFLVSKSQLIKFILIRFLITSTLTHSIYSLLLIDLKEKYLLNDFQIALFISFGAVSVFVLSLLLKGKHIEEKFPWSCILISGMVSSIMMLAIGLFENLIIIALLWGAAMSLSLINSTVFNHEKQKQYSKDEIVVVTSFTSAILGLSIIPSFAITSLLCWINVDSKLLLVAMLSCCVNAFYITKKSGRMEYERLRNSENQIY